MTTPRNPKGDRHLTTKYKRQKNTLKNIASVAVRALTTEVTTARHREHRRVRSPVRREMKRRGSGTRPGSTLVARSATLLVPELAQTTDLASRLAIRAVSHTWYALARAHGRFDIFIRCLDHKGRDPDDSARMAISHGHAVAHTLYAVHARLPHAFASAWPLHWMTRGSGAPFGDGTVVALRAVSEREVRKLNFLNF